jgi:hypothetical protein
VAEVLDRVVGDDLALMEDDDLRADLLRHFEDVGGIDDDLVLRGQAPNEVPDDEGRRDVEAG